MWVDDPKKIKATKNKVCTTTSGYTPPTNGASSIWCLAVWPNERTSLHQDPSKCRGESAISLLPLRYMSLLVRRELMIKETHQESLSNNELSWFTFLTQHQLWRIPNCELYFSLGRPPFAFCVACFYHPEASDFSRGTNILENSRWRYERVEFKWNLR